MSALDDMAAACTRLANAISQLTATGRAFGEVIHAIDAAASQGSAEPPVGRSDRDEMVGGLYPHNNFGGQSYPYKNLSREHLAAALHQASREFQRYRALAERDGRRCLNCAFAIGYHNEHGRCYLLAFPASEWVPSEAGASACPECSLSDEVGNPRVCDMHWPVGYVRTFGGAAKRVEALPVATEARGITFREEP